MLLQSSLYRIAPNFQGTKFSHISLFQIFMKVNFADQRFSLVMPFVAAVCTVNCCYCSVVTCLAWVISFFGSELPLSVAFPLFTGACQRCSRLPVGRCNGCQRKSPRQIHQSGGIHFEITVETIFLPYKGQKCME